MNVKIDTKEKFHVITPQETVLSVNMTDELSRLLLSHLEKQVKNVILNLQNVAELSTETADLLVQTQQTFYEQGVSFVICEMQPAVEQWLDEQEQLELLNATPTESEAWDIVQMEEIERELLGDE
ncbi:MAG: STAS domain-containing protein [Lacibacter sp.]|jgi:anti-anti-sigma factor